MKKTTFLLLVSGFFALSSCHEELAGPPTHQGEPLKARERSMAPGVLKAMGIEPETFAPPIRMRGNTTVNVQDYGATGGNTTDDTDAFQAAIDALPADGGTVWVPAGTYYIKTEYRQVGGGVASCGNSIRLRSNMHLKLSPYAKLRAIANSAYAAYVIFANDVDNIEISGGEIIGERYAHQDTTGEKGHGIQLRGCSQVTIRDTKISDCWGDAICIGHTLSDCGSTPGIVGSDIVIDNIIATNNRRNALSIGPSSNVQVWDSEFSDTNGTAPQCGIDIEPEAGMYAEEILIQNNLISNNDRHGIYIHNTRAVDVTIKHCEATGNYQAGIAGTGTSTYIAFNELHHNLTGKGVAVMSGADHTTVVQNTFYENDGNPARPETLHILGTNTETEKDLFVSPTAIDTVYTNHYK